MSMLGVVATCSGGEIGRGLPQAFQVFVERADDVPLQSPYDFLGQHPETLRHRSLQQDPVELDEVASESLLPESRVRQAVLDVAKACHDLRYEQRLAVIQQAPRHREVLAQVRDAAVEPSPRE